MAKPARLDWEPCIDDDGNEALIAYSQGYSCVVLHGGLLWTILSMETQLGGTTVLSGKNPPGPISLSRTAAYVNRRFSDMLKAKQKS